MRIKVPGLPVVFAIAAVAGCLSPAPSVPTGSPPV